VLPAWDGSKTAFAGSKVGFSRRKSADLGSYIGHEPALAEPRPVVKKKLTHSLVCGEAWCTAMKKWRIVILGFGTARQNMVLE
jgi:hypothetical protein